MNRLLRTCLDLVSLSRGERVQHRKDRRKVNQAMLDLEKLYMNANFQEGMDNAKTIYE
jgi:hypothetical protein